MKKISSELELSRNINVVQLRGLIVILSIVASIIAYMTYEFEVLVIVAGIGFLLSVAAFIEPLLNPIVNLLFKETNIIERRDIYDAVIYQIDRSREEILFKTPTTTWGQYSEGLRIFVGTMDAIERAVGRGVKVKIIADIWDWERAKFAQALIDVGADVRFKKTTHDYYVVRDTSHIITMGTAPEPYKIEKLDRTVRQLAKVATLSVKKRLIELSKRKFEEDWEGTSVAETKAVLKKYLSCKCPECSSQVTLKFSRGKIALKKTND